MDEDEEELCNILGKYQHLIKYGVSEFDNISVDDGLFLVFEDGEDFYGRERIVYVGNHYYEGTLVPLIKRNFWEGNKENAVIRKYIGAAILRRKNDRFFKDWMRAETDLGDEKVQMIEGEVTRYMANHMRVAVIPEKDMGTRKEILKNLVHLLKGYYSKTCAPSGKWLGNSSPEAYIRDYGMWLKSYNPK